MIDTTLSTFERDVIDASSDAPVLVSFWSPGCTPCRTLGPMLERLEREYGGRFGLVNVNAQTNPELVASFELKSIPFVVAFVDGNAVAQFSGTQPEPFLRAFLDRLIPNPAELEHRAARESLALGQVDEAEDALRNAVALDPSHDGARLDLILLLLDRNDVAQARAHYELLSSRAAQLHASYAQVHARLVAIAAAERLPPREVLETRIEADGDDLAARLDLADLFVARREFAAGMEQLLEITRRDRRFGDDVGRRRLLEVFEMAADAPELVASFRSRLSAVLF